MKIELKKLQVRDLVERYEDNDELGVRAYDDKLDVRPPYQREFVYKNKQRDAVIETLRRDFPLNVMYWAVQGDDTFEVIDGQQRTISICQYVEGDFSIPINGHQLAFHNLQQDQRDQILNYCPAPVIRCKSRLRDSRICSADLVQMKGFGSLFHSLTHVRMSASSA